MTNCGAVGVRVGEGCLGSDGGTGVESDGGLDSGKVWDMAAEADCAGAGEGFLTEAVTADGEMGGCPSAFTVGLSAASILHTG